MNQKISRSKNRGGGDVTSFKSRDTKHPKSGPRVVRKGDTAKFEAGWDRIFSKKKEEPLEEPVCPLCKGEAESGTCPCCD